jgi:enoyl-CoA hydratase/carnithine racemase
MKALERDWQFLTLQRQERVLSVSFDAGNRVNSLSNALMRELTELALALQDDSELSAVVLSGRPDMFSGGMDLKDPEAAVARDSNIAEQRRLVKTGPRMCAAWEALEPLTIVSVEGWCVGGGMALAVACDWRVASSSASLYVPELRLGMNMSWQSVPRFVNLIGPAKTKQLLLLAKPLDAVTAADWGLVDYLTPPGDALAKSLELAAQAAAMPPVPLRMIKRAVNASANALNDATSFMDAEQFLLTMGMEDAREGAAAFFEKRKAEFKGN